MRSRRCRRRRRCAATSSASCRLQRACACGSRARRRLALLRDQVAGRRLRDDDADRALLGDPQLEHRSLARLELDFVSVRAMIVGRVVSRPPPPGGAGSPPGPPPGMSPEPPAPGDRPVADHRRRRRIDLDRVRQVVVGPVAAGRRRLREVEVDVRGHPQPQRVAEVLGARCTSSRSRGRSTGLLDVRAGCAVGVAADPAAQEVGRRSFQPPTEPAIVSPT